MHSGDFVMTTRGTLGNVALYDKAIAAAFPSVRINSAMLILRPTGFLMPSLLLALLRGNLVDTFLKRDHVGSAQPHITKRDFGKMYISFPADRLEQNKIGTLLKRLDNTIALHQRKQDLLKKMKQGYLQKLFPQKGQREPELRFAGFTGDWEQRKLGDIVHITMGQSPNGENYTNNPRDYILVQGNADMKDGWVSPRVWTTQITKKARKGSIILSVRAPVGGVGKTLFDVVLGRGVAAIEGNEFLYQTLVKMNESGFWVRYSTGSTFESINSSDIKEAAISIPSASEQARIGEFMADLDTTLALHQRKLDELKKLKQAYLQKMFV